MKKVLRRAALALAVVLGALVLLFAGYVGYLQFQYYRIEDNLALEVASAPAETLAAGGEYTAVTCNLGFGAYGPDYSFFMDTGVMEDGTPTQGLYGKARSEEDVLANTTAALDALNKYFGIAQMPTAGSTYWNMVHGLTAEDAPKDEEGMQTMRNLAKNMIWMMRCFEAGKKAGVLYPDTEKQFCTNFIR